MTLIDTYLASRKKQKKFNKLLPHGSKFIEARRFVFDKEASEYMADLSLKAGIEILSQHEFARPPYDLTWIEFDQKAFHETVYGQPAGEDADTHIGYLFDNGTVWICSSNDEDSKDPMILPYKFHLHSLMSMHDELQVARQFGVSRHVYRQMVLGYKYHEDKEDSIIREVAMAHRIEQINDMFTKRLSPGDWAYLLQCGAGELKKIITTLLLITKPKMLGINFDNVGPSHGISKGKRVTYLAHNKVRMKLTKDKAVQKAITVFSTGITRRRHDVRGHWCQSRREATRNCTHVWEPITTEKYSCLRCNAKRWWRKSHPRGNSEKGLVIKEYDVKK